MKTRIVVLLLSLFALSGCNDASGGIASQNATPTPVHLEIEGMTCEGCVAAIEGTVQRIDGVASCQVSLEQGKAVVEVTDPDVMPTVIEKIEKMRYQARVVD